MNLSEFIFTDRLSELGNIMEDEALISEKFILSLNRK